MVVIEALRRHIAQVAAHVIAANKEADDLTKALDHSQIALNRRIIDCLPRSQP